MKSEIKEKAAFSRIRYSQCWEDPQCLVEALEIGGDDDVLSVTSAGCNSLALLLEEPRSVTAIDFSPIQSHLLHLKAAAIQALDYPEFLEFLGVRKSRRRLDCYRSVRKFLPDEAVACWDARREIIASGVIDDGRFDRYLALFRTRILPLIHSQPTIREAFRPKGIEAQAAFYRKVWDNRRWRMIFRVFFGKTLLGRLGRDPAFFEFVEIDKVGTNFLKRAEHAFTAIPIESNYFLKYIMTGKFSDPDLAHPYLRECNYERLRGLLPRLKIVTAAIEEYLDSLAEGTISKCNLSDIFEWMSPEQYERLLRRIVRASRDGARLAYWNLLVPRSHPPALDGNLERLVDLDRRLHLADRAFVYGDFVVERIKK